MYMPGVRPFQGSCPRAYQTQERAGAEFSAVDSESASLVSVGGHSPTR